MRAEPGSPLSGRKKQWTKKGSYAVGSSIVTTEPLVSRAMAAEINHMGNQHGNRTLGRRTSGVLLHVTSLPGPFGIGDLGPAAFRFVDFLSAAGQSIWQVLPLGPVGFGNSPYASPSTFAGNPLLISPEALVSDRLLDDADISKWMIERDHDSDRVDFERATEVKQALLSDAFLSFVQQGRQNELDGFVEQNADWLTDYALFAALKGKHGGRPWTDWGSALVHREPAALDEARHVLHEEIALETFAQFVFYKQWAALRSYSAERGIVFFGDLPIYVAHDSSDVWANRELFALDDSGQPIVVAGVPPDYFSETGQRWGNPIYRWDRLEETGYEWWIKRVRAAFDQVDIVRLDHFRGFEAYWEVPATEQTAVHGRWVKGPGQRLFDVLAERLGQLPIVAEDLGVITDEVRTLIHTNGFPGMAILQFAFGSDASNSFLTHNYRPGLVAYTGSHDNDTVHGWYASANSTEDPEVELRARNYCLDYLGLSQADLPDLHWAFVRVLESSVARTVVIPVQDLLGLSGKARMNVPGKLGGNWLWRLQRNQLTELESESLRHLTQIFGRFNPASMQQEQP